MKDFPLEIVHHTLSYLKPSPGKSPTRSERATLYACSVVHKTWYRAVQPWLFEHIGPDLSFSELECLRAAIESHPELGTLVKKLELTETGEDDDKSSDAGENDDNSSQATLSDYEEAGDTSSQTSMSSSEAAKSTSDS